jgi:hypothetical protein
MVIFRHRDFVSETCVETFVETFVPALHAFCLIIHTCKGPEGGGGLGNTGCELKRKEARGRWELHDTGKGSCSVWRGVSRCAVTLVPYACEASLHDWLLDRSLIEVFPFIIQVYRNVFIIQVCRLSSKLIETSFLLSSATLLVHTDTKDYKIRGGSG